MATVVTVRFSGTFDLFHCAFPERLFEFQNAPQPGTILKLDRHVYELREVRQHNRIDGITTDLLVWETHCPKCRGRFETASTFRARYIARRCVNCRKHGKPGNSIRDRKVRVEVIQP